MSGNEIGIRLHQAEVAAESFRRERDQLMDLMEQMEETSLRYMRERDEALAKIKRMIDHIINERAVWDAEFNAVCANGESLHQMYLAARAENRELQVKCDAAFRAVEDLGAQLDRCKRELAQWNKSEAE